MLTGVRKVGASQTSESIKKKNTFFSSIGFYINFILCKVARSSTCGGVFTQDLQLNLAS